MPKLMSPRELAMRLESGDPVYLLDVRKPEEHTICHLPNDNLIPLADLLSRMSEIQPSDGVPIVVYCHHGIRSQTGAALCERAGLSPVYSLAGGIDAWSEQVDPTVPRY